MRDNNEGLGWAEGLYKYLWSHVDSFRGLTRVFLPTSYWQYLCIKLCICLSVQNEVGKKKKEVYLVNFKTKFFFVTNQDNVGKHQSHVLEVSFWHIRTSVMATAAFHFHVYHLTIAQVLKILTSVFGLKIGWPTLSQPSEESTLYFYCFFFF